MKAETVKFTKTVEIADADGQPIREGSVLRQIEDGDRGVVVRIVRAGMSGTVLDAIGDLNIATGPGSTRVTNNYKKWRHIPHNEQTYKERFQSWMKTPETEGAFEHLREVNISKDEAKAIDGIMALLPDDVVDWVYTTSPDRLEAALGFMAEHLMELKQLCQASTKS